jgi:lipopolysaccharide biosynthesis regulator YciM
LATEALNWCDDAVWPQIILARLDHKGDKAQEAYDRLLRLAQASPDRLPEFIQDLLVVSDEIDRRDDVTDLLSALLEHTQDPQMRVIAAEEYLARGQQARALDVIKQGLLTQPSPKLLRQAIELLGEDVVSPEVIAGAQRLASRQSAYLCGVCGFHGPSFYWQCPGCKSWDTLHRPKQ